MFILVSGTLKVWQQWAADNIIPDKNKIEQFSLLLSKSWKIRVCITLPWDFICRQVITLSCSKM
jgi:hypothetical protein